MHPQPPPLTVLMVHYGNPAETTRALRALWAGAHTPSQVLIIDHAEEPLVLPEHSRQRIIRPRANGGYAAGLNIGLGVLFARNPQPNEIIVCMNNDVRVSTESLKRLLDYFTQQSQSVIVGARWGRVHPLTGRSILLAAAHPKPITHSSLMYLDGAFFASTWAVWLKLQKIPDEYFMYWEESALQVKATQRGIHQHVLSDLNIDHDDAVGTSSPQRTYYLVRNGAHYMQTSTILPVRWWWKVYNRVRYVYHLLRPTNKQSSLMRRALSDALRGVRGQTHFAP